MAMLPLLAIAIIISLLFGAPCALAEAASDDPAGESEEGQTFEIGARNPEAPLRFDGLDFRPDDEQRQEIFGIPLRQTLREGLTMGVTAHGITWKVDW